VALIDILEKNINSLDIKANIIPEFVLRSRAEWILKGLIPPMPICNIRFGEVGVVDGIIVF